MNSQTKHRLNWYLLAGAALLSFLLGLTMLQICFRPSRNLTGQEEIRHYEEKLLASKILKVLEPVVGKDKVRAEVHLDLNFDTIITNEEFFDPEGQVLKTYRAEKNFASEVEYEISKTKRRITQNGAKIRKLSVLIMVDDLRDGTYSQERSRDEMNYLAGLIMPVIGFDKQRGDVIKMESIRFDRRFWKNEQITDILIFAVVLLSLLIIFHNKNQSPKKEENCSTEKDKKKLQPENNIAPEKRKSPTDIWKQLEKTDIEVLQTYLEKETPAVAAYILSRLDTYKGGQLISSLPTDFAAAVLACLSDGTSVNAELAEEIEKNLAEDFNSQTGFGSCYVQKLLKNLNFKKQKKILTALEDENFATAEKLRTALFNFEDFCAVSNKDIKRLFDDVEKQDLALALRGASEKLQQHMFANMGKSAVAEIQKQMTELGPVRLRQVEDAQDKIMSIALVLHHEKKITLQKNNGAEIQ